MTTVKFMLIQKTEADPVVHLDGDPHVGETFYTDLSELVEDLASGQDNFWTYQVLSIEFDGDLVVGMQDISQNVCNLVEAVSWANAQMDFPVHPMAFRGNGDLEAFLEMKNVADDARETGRKLDSSYAARCIDMGVAI